MGPILTAIFYWQAQVNKEEEQAEVLLKLFFLLLGMCLINPSGINGFLMPFHIDKAYTYPVIDEYSVLDLLKLKILRFRSVLLYFLTASGMLMAGLFFLLRREGIKKNILSVTVALLLSVVALKAERLIGLFSYFWIPLSIHVYGRWMQSETAKVRKNIEIMLVVLGIIVSFSVNFNWSQGHGFGIIPGTNDAAEFFKREKISGPIFNDYDIGGYLIFHLSPQYQLFVDDREEAFPEDFLKRTYLEMQINEGLWHQLDQKYHFNVIFITPEISINNFRFIMHRFEDPLWAPVFLKVKAIILLKRNVQNAQIIRRNEILTDVTVRPIHL